MTTTVLDDGSKLESPFVVVGVGAKPNTDLFKGQLELLNEKPGGIPVRPSLCGRRYCWRPLLATLCGMGSGVAACMGQSCSTPPT